MIENASMEEGGTRASPRIHSMKAVEALARITKAEALLQHLFSSEPVQGISHRPGWKIGSADDVLLRQGAVGCKHLEDILCRGREKFHNIRVRRAHIVCGCC